MAGKGMTLTNYHTAAAICTPTRASILTGMYPWRVGIKAVFELGKPGDKHGWLPPLPTIPMALREGNYSVFHSGKWHLGGMRNDDLDMRQLVNNRRCPHPGPNQQGFKNYVSMLDGPGSPRLNALQQKAQLYSQGCTALRHNDADIGHGQYNITGYLSFCEAEHAIHAMNVSVVKHKPFFINLWFNAPHSPLEEIPGWHEKLTGESRNYDDPDLKPLDLTGKYRTMVADMDHQVGRVLRNLEALGIEKSTLVIFTSDNGPEPWAGSRAGLNGAKRFLYEGGIRVPTIVQWVGTIPAGTTSDMFAMSTDLFPTFLDAAGVPTPSHLHLDGLSMLPRLLPDYYAQPRVEHPIAPVPHAHPSAQSREKHAVDVIKDDKDLYAAAIRDRVTLWHCDYEGPRRTAAWIYDYKLILDETDQMTEMYDMKNDMYEKKNLILKQPAAKVIAPLDPALAKKGTTVGAKPASQGKITLDMVLNDRGNPAVHIWIASHMYPVLRDFVHNGNQAHAQYMQKNPGWRYIPTAWSANSHNQPASHEPAEEAKMKHQALREGSCGDSPCTCEVKLAHQVPSLPFEDVSPEFVYMQPGNLLNGAELLRL